MASFEAFEAFEAVEAVEDSAGAGAGGAVRALRAAGVARRAVVALWRALAALVWPVQCAGCGVETVAGAPLCPPCALPWAGPPVIVELGSPELPGGVVVIAAHEGAAARAVVAWKDHGRRDLTPVLAAAVARALEAALALAAAEEEFARTVAGSGRDEPPSSVESTGGAERRESSESSERRIVLVPAPSRGEAVRARGEDRLAALAARVARTRPGLARRRWLHLVRTVSDQAGLGRAARRVNLAGAMRARVGASRAGTRAVGAGRQVVTVLVDDIVTTGSTAREALRAMRSVPGIRPVAVVALSRTPLRRPGRSTSGDAPTIGGP